MSEFTQEELLSKAQYWRKDIHFKQDVLGRPFEFYTTWGIFSPEKLDDGSLMLLDYIDFKSDDNSIDLGCGYGVLGMTAARECPDGQHLLIDKDFVAVEYGDVILCREVYPEDWSFGLINNRYPYTAV